MGKFFEEWHDEGGDFGAFVSGDEKEVLISEGTPFVVTKVTEAETKYGPRWILSIEIEGDARALGFARGNVFSRDRMLDAMRAYLEAGGDAPTVRIVREGRSQLLVDAEE